MKEIIQLIRELKGYPPNSFAYIDNQCDLPEGLYSPWYIEEHTKSGLMVCDLESNQQGFIETGGKEGVITE